MPVNRRGLTDFTFTRYLCPWIVRQENVAEQCCLFLDADMLCRGDIWELDVFASEQIELDDAPALWVNKSQPRFEWPSMMLFNVEHPDCMTLTPEWINDEANNPAELKWTTSVGQLPDEWNQCVGYNPEYPGAKMLHFTMGTPCWEEVRNLEGFEDWRQEQYESQYSVSWLELMGGSVHAPHVLEVLSGKDTL